MKKKKKIQNTKVLCYDFMVCGDTPFSTSLINFYCDVNPITKTFGSYQMREDDVVPLLLEEETAFSLFSFFSLHRVDANE